MVSATALPPYAVRLARPGEEDEICRVCRAGFTSSSTGLLPPDLVERQAQRYYDPARVRREITTAGADPAWQGYVVAITDDGRVLGAAGGGVLDRSRGQLYVIYLEAGLRGRGIGTALLDAVTEQQRQVGATEQWVSVTEGNSLGLPFYRARGFDVRDRVPYVDPDDLSVAGHSLRMGRAI
ncbi:hypothetical protein GCM10011376_37140 [Nocardioides flavus (ex Wang et al. 2016)]|uniref:N-acetyltransferase domain-containing protein n=1 Tax=Nocardioides flavus (ex Wang et al. 2016) TaxID=2058780 RepID=A0ABQ3HR48_9ACTN|nr:hypothetical protein GCM10011376_37140 [Nocardioides flavus (ex Wang et al. 2016)]